MSSRIVFVALLGSLCAAAPIASAQRPKPAGPSTVELRQSSWERHQELDRTSIFRGLPWRSVGPIVQGGRIVDIEVVPGKPYSFFVAYASGGLFKTDNNGVTFEPLFDDQSTIIMGDIAIDHSNPDVIWVGTGENNSSRSSYGGFGVFKSEDGGVTWRHVGLSDTDRIGRILIDPRNSDHVLVAALGKLYTPGGERGIYRTTDGGATWARVLAGDGVTGFADMVRDPSNPDILLAASWERSRRPWDFVEGGTGSGVWKSVDNGATWTRLGGGLPQGEHVGRIGLDIAASSPNIVYAYVDNQELLPEDEWDPGDGAVTAKRLRTMTREEFLGQDPEEIEDFLRGNDLDPTLDAESLIEQVKSGEVTLDDLRAALEDANRSLFETDIVGPEVYRSDDGGTSWRRTHEDRIRDHFYTYGYYFGQIRVSPADPDHIFIMGVPLLVSEDVGATWSNINHRGVHVDHHALWIDPAFPDRLVLGNDGGIDMSFDGGESWLTLSPSAVGQFYTVAVDMADPYNIYGGLQDNGTVKGSSRSRPGVTSPWEFIGGGDGMYVQIDPRDDKTTYVGSQFGYYTRIGADGSRERVRPRNRLKEPAIRYNWSSPILLSPHNADILYFGTNTLYRSMDKGETWTAISPDLTRSEHRGDVPFATITSIAESPKTFGLIWVGTDDGQVHVTEDGGVAWRDVGPRLPSDRWVSRVETSSADERTAYVTLNGYRDDDMTAYVYRTDDLGSTWIDISRGLPAEPVNVIREDPVNPKVLYVGTDRGVYVSLGGTSWYSLPAEMPNVPVHDLVVHPRERELVAGTHGRSIYVLDVLPIQELTVEVSGSKVHVFPLEDYTFRRSWRSRRSTWFYRSDDDEYIDVPYWSADGGEGVFEVLDDDGRVLRREDVQAVAGVNVYRWDLLLDEGLALDAERARLKEKEAGDAIAKADRPWAEAVRLARSLYVTAGSYAIRIAVGTADARTELVVKPPAERKPRVKPEPRIRGEKVEKK